MYRNKRSILQFTYDIEECADVIKEEVSNISFEEFLNNRKTVGILKDN